MRRYFMVILAAAMSLALVLGACSQSTPAPTTTAPPPPKTTTTAPPPPTTAKPATTTTAPVASPSPSPKPTTTSPSPSPSPAAQSAADFYKTASVSILVPSSAGGGSDFSARLFASYWPQYTGGHMTVENKPGAGGLLAINTAYNAKPDGLTFALGHHPSDIISPWMFKDAGVQFDPAKMNWIGMFGASPGFFVVGKEKPYKTMADLQKAKGLKLASSGPSGHATFGSAVASWLFNLDARIITSYDAAPDIGLATFRGEVDGYSMQGNVIKTHLDSGWIKYPFFVEDFTRSAWFKDAPALPELLKLTPEQEKLVKVFITLTPIKSIFVGPNVPADKVEFIRGVFDKMMLDKGFLQQAAYVFPVWEKPVSGKDVAANVNAVASMPDADKNKLTEITKQYIK